MVLGTCAGLAALATTSSGLCFVGGADSAIKTFDLKTGEMMDDFVVEVLGEEVELTCFEVYEVNEKEEGGEKESWYLFFGTTTGMVGLIPIPKGQTEKGKENAHEEGEENENGKFRLNAEDISVVYRTDTGRGIRDLTIYKAASGTTSDLLAIATQSSFAASGFLPKCLYKTF